MRFSIAAVCVLAVAACGQPNSSSAPAETAPTPQAALAAPDLLGMYEATSTTAMAITGNLEVNEAALVSAMGLVYDTAVLGPADLDAAIAAGQEDNLRTSLGLEVNRTIQAAEIRRVLKAVAPPLSPNQGLCGEQAVSHLVLAIAPPAEGEEAEPQFLWLAAFAGSDAPGPDAQNSTLCGTFLYAREIAS